MSSPAESRVAFLGEASARLSGSLDLPETLRCVLDLAVPYLADFAMIWLVEPNGSTRHLLARSEAGGSVGVREWSRPPRPESAESGLLEEVLRSGRPVLRTHCEPPGVAGAPIGPDGLDLPDDLEPVSLLAVPLMAGPERLGVLLLGTGQSRRTYGSTEQTLAEDLARRAGFALAHARLYAEARASEREARELYAAALAIGGEHDLDARLQRILEAVLVWPPVAVAQVGLVDPSGTFVEICAASGGDGTDRGWRCPIRRGLIGLTIATNRPVRSGDMPADPRAYQGPGTNAGSFRSWLGVPLSDAGRPFGLLIARGVEPDAFGPDHERRLMSLAALAASAVRESRLTRRLEEALRARDEFLSVAAHELKTPLTSLRGYAQLAVRQLDRSGRLSPALSRKALQVIDDQSRKLARLIEQLLDISRIEAGRLRLDRRTTDLALLLREAVINESMTTGHHQIRVSAPPSAIARVDPLRIEQVLTNLLDNAIKYSPSGGEIEAKLTTTPAEAILSVRDYGIGITEEQRRRIFDRYYQANAGVSGGMGLGLFIVAQIVELHGGRIEIDAPAGGGTRVTVRLPVEPPAGESGEAPHA